MVARSNVPGLNRRGFLTAPAATAGPIRRLAANGPRRRDTTRTYQRPGGLTVLIAAAAIGLAACGGSANAPHVASLGNSSGNGGGSPAAAGSSPTTLSQGNPTQLLNEWAACMRRHGDPSQADPTIEANKVININIPPGIQGGVYGYSGEYGPGGPGLHCRTYLTAAQTALKGGRQPEQLSQAEQAKLLKFSKCMRANGISDYPDPSGGNLSFNIGAGGDLNPQSPTFQNASKLCVKKTGVQVPGSGTPPPGTIEIDGSGPGGGSG